MGGSIGGSAGVDMVVDAIELLNEACSARGTAMRYVRSTTRGCPDLRASVRVQLFKTAGTYDQSAVCGSRPLSSR